MGDLRSERGATVVEFVFAGTFFFLFVLLALDVLLMSLNVLTIQFIATDVMRSSVVVAPNSLNTADYASKEDFIEKTILQRGIALGLPVTEEHIEIYTFDETNNRIDGAGGAGDPFVLEITTPLRGLLSGSQFHFLGAEPFSIFGSDFSITTTILSQNELYNE